MDIFDVIKAEIRDKKEVIESDIVHNKPKDIEEYRYLCGVYNGFLRMESFIEELERNVKDD